MSYNVSLVKFIIKIFFFDKYHSCYCCHLKDVRRKMSYFEYVCRSQLGRMSVLLLIIVAEMIARVEKWCKMYGRVGAWNSSFSLSLFWNFSAPTATVTNKNHRCKVLLSKTCSYQRQMISKVTLLQQHCKQCFSFALSRFETRAICKLISWFIFFFSLLLFTSSSPARYIRVWHAFVFIFCVYVCDENAIRTQFFFNATTNKPHRCRHRRLNAKENNFIL